MSFIEIIYVTNDAVHQSMAEEFALEFGAMITRLRPEKAPPVGTWFDAVLYDLDAMALHCRPSHLAKVISGRSKCPTAVHGYYVSGRMVSLLRRHRIAASRRLSPELFRWLCQSVRDHLDARTSSVIE